MGGAEYIEITAPSLALGFAGPFDIVIDGIVVATILPGESYFFDPLADVTTFDLLGIYPLLDIEDAGAPVNGKKP